MLPMCPVRTEEVLAERVSAKIMSASSHIWLRDSQILGEPNGIIFFKRSHAFALARG